LGVRLRDELARRDGDRPRRARPRRRPHRSEALRRARPDGAGDVDRERPGDFAAVEGTGAGGVAFALRINLTPMGGVLAPDTVSRQPRRALMDYVKVWWKHDNPSMPTLLYSELDERRWETRKIEIFGDG